MTTIVLLQDGDRIDLEAGWIVGGEARFKILPEYEVSIDLRKAATHGPSRPAATPLTRSDQIIELRKEATHGDAVEAMKWAAAMRPPVIHNVKKRKYLDDAEFAALWEYFLGHPGISMTVLGKIFNIVASNASKKIRIFGNIKRTPSAPGRKGGMDWCGWNDRTMSRVQQTLTAPGSGSSEERIKREFPHMGPLFLSKLLKDASA
jgi:hypothetical protein